MTEDQADYVNFGRPWRVGRSLGRTLYVLAGDDASKDDVVFGMVDDPELARHIVRLHNEWVDRWQAECREFGCHATRPRSIGDDVGESKTPAERELPGVWPTT